MKAKPTKSPTLTRVNRHYDERYARFAEHMDRAMAKWPTFPHGHRGAVFCWLWDNRAAVVHAMKYHWLSWDQIAIVADGDGVKGRWDKPPTGNAMRRVWVRVCQEAGEREQWSPTDGGF